MNSGKNISKKAVFLMLVVMFLFITGLTAASAERVWQAQTDAVSWVENLVSINWGNTPDTYNYDGSNIIATGSCGDDATWTLYEDMTLVISGTGTIKQDYRGLSEYKRSIQKVFINEGITAIGNNSFTNFSSMKEIKIPEGVTTIGSSAFFACTSLEEVELPKSLTEIKNYAFVYCTSLSKILPEDNPRTSYHKCYDGEFYDFTLPASVEIGLGVFIKTKVGNITTIDTSVLEIPKKTELIEEEAFAGLPMEHVRILQLWGYRMNIGSKAFANCKNLKYFEITSDGMAEPENLQIADDAFEGCRTDIIIISGIEGEFDIYLKQYAQDHGFTYIKNELYPGNG